MGHTVTLGRPARRRRTPSGRRLAALRSLVASGVTTVYDLTFGTLAGRYYNDRVLEAGMDEIGYASWPCEKTLQPHDLVVYRDGESAVYALPGAYALLRLSWGTLQVSVASRDAAKVEAALASFRADYPATYLDLADDGRVRVPITFWTLGPHGPIQRMRMIDSQSWPDIEANYASEVRDGLDALMDGFEPGKSGQLLLWQGPPGTGKTWALRALASEWRAWAEFHYITDPDAFFVDDPSYMIDVLLADSYEAIEPTSGDVFATSDPDGKWRVLILEDTGELLSATAKEKYGQGLSRLLNVVDGMIGQGLRVLCLVTTNDELGELNPAVLRPGRCASQVVFRPLDEGEVAALLGEPVEGGATIAEVYARRGEGEEPIPAEPDPEDARELTASARSDLLAEVRAVAEEHAPDGGYGDTWWRESDSTVFWNAADWSGDDEVEAAAEAFLAIDGVDAFEYDAEVGDMSGEGYERVWPEARAGAALEDVVALAAEPLDVEADPDAGVVLAALEARLGADTRSGLTQASLMAALTAIAASHERSVEAIAGLVAAAAREDGAGRSDVLAFALADALKTFAARPAPRPSPVTVHVPQPDVSVTVEGATVHVPAQPPAQVHYHDDRQAAPIVVNVPAQPAPKPADVHVHVPAAEPARVEVHVPPAPVVAAVPPERQPLRGIRVEYDAQGNKLFVPVELEEEEE